MSLIKKKHFYSTLIACVNTWSSEYTSALALLCGKTFTIRKKIFQKKQNSSTSQTNFFQTFLWPENFVSAFSFLRSRSGWPVFASWAIVFFVGQFFENYRRNQGCQKVYFQTKNPNSGKFWRDLQWKVLVYFMAFCSVLLQFGIFCDHLVKVMVIWYIFPLLVCILYHEKSGNPGRNQTFLAIFYTEKWCITFVKNGSGNALGDIFTNSSGHPVRAFLLIYRHCPGLARLYFSENDATLIPFSCTPNVTKKD
jgi:hypothetical protein